jgi:hypothetical protein
VAPWRTHCADRVKSVGAAWHAAMSALSIKKQAIEKDARDNAAALQAAQDRVKSAEETQHLNRYEEQRLASNLKAVQDRLKAAQLRLPM